MAEYGKMYKKTKAQYEEPTEVVDPVEKVEPEDKFGFVAHCEKAYIREGASIETDHKAIVNKGDRLLLYGAEDGWYKVVTESGCDGYIRGDLVQIDK